MSHTEMGGTMSSPASEHGRTEIHFDSDSPTTEAHLKSDFVASNSSSPSLASTMDAPSRHDRLPGEQLQAIQKQHLVESGADYKDIFNELQIKPEHHDEVVTGILHQIRRGKRLKHLQTASDAMIKDLSRTFVRGYCKILYRTAPSKWLVPEAELQLEGKERLQFTPNNSETDGPNAHFYRILEPMWWIMRDIVFEVKPPAKRRGQPKRTIDGVLKEGVDDDSYQGDNDTEVDLQLPKEKSMVPRGRGRPPKAVPKERFEDKQKQVLNRIEQEIEASDAKGSRKQQHHVMTADQTDEAVYDLIGRLHDIRCQSQPDSFARSWETYLARLDEIEDIEDFEHGVAIDRAADGQLAAAQSPNTALHTAIEEHPARTRLRNIASHESWVPVDPIEMPGLMPTSDPNIPVLSHAQNRPVDVSSIGNGASGSHVDLANDVETHGPRNLSNEPFNTQGSPSPLDQLGRGQTPLIPSKISLYITTTPALQPYKDKSYHWPDAPVSITDCKRLFDGIDQRVAVRNISSFTLSYGWNDVMRFIENDEEGRRHGFSELRRDIADAAKMGVTRWRLKVLVAGEAQLYQKRV